MCNATRFYLCWFYFIYKLEIIEWFVLHGTFNFIQSTSPAIH